MGQYRNLTQNITASVLAWRPTIGHDLHEAQSYLYISTGTGPYNDSLDPIQVDEWWMLAETEVMETAKRNIPRVWTYGFYDGWVPNYLLWIATTHNLFGRFYEGRSYGPGGHREIAARPGATSRERHRPNPPLATIKWGPRNNTNIQESALFIAIHKVAIDRELYLENYWLKNRRAVEKGAERVPFFALVIRLPSGASADAADMVNQPAHQGLEILAPRRRSVRATGSGAGRLLLSAPTSPTVPSRTCISACRIIRRRIRALTTTPAGPCSTCATSKSRR